MSGAATPADRGSPLNEPGGCAGIGITGQWGSTVAVGNDGIALAPCALWSDHRGAPWSKKITGDAEFVRLAKAQRQMYRRLNGPRAR